MRAALSAGSRGRAAPLARPAHPNPAPRAAAPPRRAPAAAPRRRTELDYGLGGRGDAPREEALLVVAEPGALRALLAALGPGGGGGGAAAAAAAAAAGAVLEVRAGGWNQGVAAEQQRALPSWRDLRPALAPQGAPPPLQQQPPPPQQQSLEATQ